MFHSNLSAMEQEDIFYRKAEYIETASGNKVSRQSVLCGSQNIILNGMFTSALILGCPTLVYTEITRHSFIIPT